MEVCDPQIASEFSKRAWGLGFLSISPGECDQGIPALNIRKAEAEEGLNC